MAMLPGRVALDMESALNRARTNLLNTWDICDFGPWLVQEKGSEEILGHCGLRHWPGGNEVEVLYALIPSVWGLGYATEAARVAVDEGFSSLQCDRVIAGVCPENLGSVRVLQKLGMEVWKDAHFFGMDLRMYQLYRRDWIAGSPVTAADP
jgi:ribosomal-protein-alanine N-acetyltransferase